MSISGFTFVHNALNAGIPIRESINAVLPYVDELVVVDAESNDGTREWLDAFRTSFCPETERTCRIIDAKWGTDGGETLKRLHAMNVECEGDVIIHFEADEVFDDKLIKRVKNLIDKGANSLLVWRLQVEQNFQRIRWYPELVHRVFKKGTVIKEGHTTNRHDIAGEMSPKGFIWDVTNCFRDQWYPRIQQQAELRKDTETGGLNLRRVPLHFNHNIDLLDPNVKDKTLQDFLDEPHWLWTETPLNIPDILKPLVGKTKYE